ncbi:MAG: hypothetical protein Q4C70_10345 [Planctomycetia bacterium]|nr:hypothetical protein [Planctomycetia bacterium]
MTRKIEMKSSNQKRTIGKKLGSLGTFGIGLGLFLGTACVPLTAWSENYTWDGQNGNWTDTAHWSPNGTPGDNDTATINAGTVTSESPSP